MCTHQMRQVEELCDRLVLINKGKTVLYGSLQEVRRRFAKPEINVISGAEFPNSVMGVNEIIKENNAIRLRLDNDTSPQEVLKNLIYAGVALESFEVATPSLDEIFIQVVQEEEPQP